MNQLKRIKSAAPVQNAALPKVEAAQTTKRDSQAVTDIERWDLQARLAKIYLLALARYRQVESERQEKENRSEYPTSERAEHERPEEVAR